MNANDAWSAAQALEGATLHRWTKSGELGKPFTYEIRDAGRGPGIKFLRDGREVKSASFDRFCRFYEGWCCGQRSADHFQNDGRLQSEAQVARFLIPVYEMVVRSLNAARPMAADATPFPPEPAPKRLQHAEPSPSAPRRAATSGNSFDARLRQLVPESDLSRPFMCLGDPLVAELFIVGLNPGTDTPFWPCWNGSTFDKEAWLWDYLSRHNGKYNKTRSYLERLIDGLDGVPVLETNLYPYPTRQFKQLPRELQQPDVLDFLVTSIRPRVMFIMGKETIKYVSGRANLVRLPKGEIFTTVTWSDITIDVMAENHFAIQQKYWDESKIDRVAATLKARWLQRQQGEGGPVPLSCLEADEGRIIT